MRRAHSVSNVCVLRRGPSLLQAAQQQPRWWCGAGWLAQAFSCCWAAPRRHAPGPGGAGGGVGGGGGGPGAGAGGATGTLTRGAAGNRSSFMLYHPAFMTYLQGGDAKKHEEPGGSSGGTG